MNSIQAGFTPAQLARKQINMYFIDGDGVCVCVCCVWSTLGNKIIKYGYSLVVCQCR